VSAPAGRIGARVKRGDDPRLLTGRGRYVDDVTVPRMVHAAFVRSTHAHARLVRVDLDRAGRAPGVVGVLAGDAVARLCKPYRGVLLHYKGMKTGAVLPLAVARVRYVGEPIVAIAAESRAAADDAAALVGVEAHAADIQLGGGRAVVRGSPERGLSYAELARAAHFRSNELRGVEPSLEATVHDTNPAAWTFTNGAHLAVVEVDVETGQVRVLRYVAVDDCGRMVNPALVEGQIAGGIAQGLGGALKEHCVYDDTGQLLSATLMDYAVPTLPTFRRSRATISRRRRRGSPAASKALAKRGRREHRPRF
jgi:CO/xanthine dehydrogenase Mo-binding subunit